MTAGTLYVVATPLGNLEDLSPRAVRILGGVHLVACEDTRRTRPLLAAHGLHTATTSFFEHNEAWKGQRILETLRKGQDVALVSDAGTPGISDPGFRLVREARAAGLSVVPVPGPSALVTALSVSGLPTDRFRFLGFLPPRPAARRKALHALEQDPDTLIFYESPQRVVDTLGDMLEVLGDREAFLCREATKLHEEYRTAALSALLALLGERGRVRGEIVLVVAGAPAASRSETESPARMVERLQAEGRTRRQAVKETAARLGLPAREVYRLALASATGDSAG